MRKYSLWLSSGEEVEIIARNGDSAFSKAKKIAKSKEELMIRIDDTTDIEFNEECPTIWER